jgi:DNA-binding beta-propeller fold protein YncE
MRRLFICIAAGLAALPLVGIAGAGMPARPGLEGTIWVGNRGFPAIAAFEASTGELVRAVALAAPASDVATGKGKIYVGEETANRIAVIDGRSGEIVTRIATAAAPHHLAAGSGGNLVAYGAFGSNRVGVLDTRTDTLVGEWPASASPLARVHAAALSRDGQIVYTANDVVNEIGAVDVSTGNLLFTIPVSRAHELIVSPDGRLLYVASRAESILRVVDLESREVVAELPLGPLPDTLQLSANGKQLTVGLRGTPAQVAVVDTETLAVTAIVTIPGGSLAGHQWTSGNGRYTFAAYEGSPGGLAVIDHATSEVVQTVPFPGGGRPHGIDYAGPQAG